MTHNTTSHTGAAGARAALELRLQDAQRDLAELIAEKNGYLSQADVCSALACEPGRGTVANNTAATNLRLKAFSLGGQIATLKLRVRNLESQLKGAPAQVAPVVLSSEQLAAVDDTAGLCGVAA